MVIIRTLLFPYSITTHYMKPFLCCIAAVFTASAALPAQAATYICKDGGRAVYSTIRLNAGCTLSQMDGTVTLPAGGIALPGQSENAWESEQPAHDIKIAPSARDTTVTNTAEAASPSLQVKIRNNKAKKQTPRKPIVVPHITAAPAKQQLSRHQILQNEIRNEQAALVRANAQLSIAKKKGDKAKTTRLQQEIRDREASIRAIQAEMKR
ncbi:hypothetical protein [Neisseria musculi]|uniref:DUF4124 domain-containing protein n=1 Tax=Neisseria musculi TaxID=1815583 RepID=A0A7H1M8U4_9NEIS|nr:hypothetical protein [Neisseria musculi]QNT58059.1 hypothetical protein H7A79_1964 [Neisseria musculi]